MASSGPHSLPVAKTQWAQRGQSQSHITDAGLREIEAIGQAQVYRQRMCYGLGQKWEGDELMGALYVLLRGWPGR